MAELKKFFPLSWKYTKDIKDLIIGIVIYLVAGLLAGAVIALATQLTGWLGFIGGIIGWALGIVGTVVGLYVLAGIVLLLLVYFKVIKD